jgi:GTP-binding protein Era
LNAHKAGFVNIIGRPNVGKSTLCNLLMGDKMSIVTHKPQTTRHRILGILNDEDYQIVFSDSPGIITDPNYELHKSMNKFAYSSLEDADILIIMSDLRKDSLISESLVSTVNKLDVPVFLVINKTDTAQNEHEVDEMEKRWTEHISFRHVFRISALNQTNTAGILPAILQDLPECPPYYPKDQFSDKSERFFVSEIIREQIFLLYQEEIPYSVEVEVEEFKESILRGREFIHIYANIYVSRKSQKAILIGQKGSKIKQLGIDSRIAIEAFFKKGVHLELFVKIMENWRDSDTGLKNFGYHQ